MIPTFTLPAGYTSRKVVLCLSREGDGWAFYGVAFSGPNGRDTYAVGARNPVSGVLLPTFKTRALAAEWANVMDLPAYATWNGRRRHYEGLGFESMAHARAVA